MMNLNKTALLAGLVVSGIAVGCVFSTKADAAIVITGQETGGNVVFSYSGSIDLTGGSIIGDESSLASEIYPPSSVVYFGGSATRYGFTAIDGPPSYGSGLFVVVADIPNTGSAFGLVPSGGLLFVPSTYTSGSPISGSMQFSNTTFAGLGVTPGTYVWTLPNSDTITLNASTAVPEPLNILGATTGLTLFGIASTALKRKKVSK